MNASPQAHHAVRAAKNYNRWGERPATIYASKHNVSALMFCMALGFEERRAKRKGGAA